ncbi:MAG: retroviral-like aspartic protease family protein [Acidobacteriota bacterium]|nr:retroviral-like aspartic protease family protein [Acidobacteriota bacterium]MDH3783897.1 retroviral-like aspartic protease family protein [Acidobacteriota bacterium]
MRSADPRWITTFTSVLISLVSWVLFSTSDTELSTTPTLEQIRRAAGTDDLPTGDRCLSIQGGGSYRGTDANYEMQLGAGGAYRYEIDGPMATVVTSDGQRVWQRDGASAVFELQLIMKEALRLGIWIESGYWLAEEAPIVLGEPLRRGDDWVVTARTRDGLLDVVVTLDEDTFHPTHVDMANFGADLAIDYSDYRAVDGLKIPHRIRGTDEAGGVDDFRVRKAVTTDCNAEALASLPRGVDDTTFDSATPSQLNVRRIGTGHVAVKPVIDGKPTGWFIFDSGAGASVITPAAAKRLGLEKVGMTVLGGSGEDVAATPLYAIDTFQLGPMTVQNLAFMEMDIDTAVPSLRGIEGVIGWDILIRARVAMELDTPALNVHDSAGEADADIEWQPLVLHGKHPHVPGTFDGGQPGLFSLDTGAANTTVVFYSPVVERFSLLGKKSGPTRTFNGAGGASRYVNGRLGWVEIGGHRYDDLPVRLSLDKAGAMADPYGLGNVGVTILRDYRLVFDYPNQRIALVAL